MKNFLLVLVAVGMIFTACEPANGLDYNNNDNPTEQPGGGSQGGDENGETPSMPKIELSQQYIEVGFEPAQYSVSITSPYSWEATSRNDWIVIDTKSGIAGTKELKFSVLRNELEIREGTIVIKNEDYNLVAELYVTQKAFVPAITIEPESLAFAADGGTQEVAITTNFEYEVLENSEWLIVESIENGIKVTVPPSYVMETRNTVITILNNEYNISDTIDVVQEPAKWSKHGSIIGSWKLTTWCEEESINQVYMDFHENNTFDLYQKLYSLIWLRYKGTYSLNDNILTGVYSDGIAWGAEYNVLYGINEICLIKKSDNSDIAIYTKETIPNHIIDEAKDPDSTRSEIKHRYF